MIKVFSRNIGSEVLLNKDQIVYIAPSLDGGSIIHLASGQVLPVTNNLTYIENLLSPKEKIQETVINTSIIPTGQSGKVYPDEFPDDWPRFKSGVICRTSKKYLEYIKEQEENNVK